MKYCMVFVIISLLAGCEVQIDDSTEYVDITSKVSVEDFEEIKNYIIQNGKFEMFSNAYMQNPYADFEHFDLYLFPDVGLLNSSCDPEISDFNQLFIVSKENITQYRIVRIKIGDTDRTDIQIPIEGKIREDRNYLRKYQGVDLQEMYDAIEYIIDDLIEETESQ